jgi:hypothetical protein
MVLSYAERMNLRIFMQNPVQIPERKIDSSQVFTQGESWGTSDGTPGPSADIFERQHYEHP